MNRALRFAALSALLAALPVVALASGDGGSDPWMDLALKFVNFVGLIVIFWYLLRKAIPQALRDRKAAIAKDLISARESLEAAEAELADYKSKVVNLEQEVNTLKVEFEREGELQRERIISEAKQAAETISKNAAAAGERESRKVIEELKSDAVRMALEAAEKIVAESYGAADQQKALTQTIEKIEGLQ
jgi:F-type H+-transporting ATPase subunit b